MNNSFALISFSLTSSELLRTAKEVNAAAKTYAAPWLGEGYTVRKNRRGEFAPKDKAEPDMTWKVEPEIEAIACQTDERLQVVSDRFYGLDTSQQNQLTYIESPVVKDFLLDRALEAYANTQEEIVSYLDRQRPAIAFRSILRYSRMALRSEGLDMAGAFGVLWAIAPIMGWMIIESQDRTLYEMAQIDIYDEREPMPSIDAPDLLHGWGGSLIISGPIQRLSIDLLNRLLFGD